MKIAWIGLGTMGEAMAGHLLDAGHDLTVHNRTREREAALADAWGEQRRLAARGRAGSRAGRPLRPDSPDVEALVLGPGGVAEGIRGAPSCSTARRSRRTPRAGSPAALAERGAGAVDAPVSGGSEGARKGQLTAFVGGEDAHVATARPALEAFCRSITHLGGPGSGQAGKAVNQVLISGTYAALGEGLALGEKEGLPLEALVAALGGGAAGSWILQNRSGNVIRGTYPLGFRMELHLEDLRIALAEADRLGLPMEVTRLVAEHAQRLVDSGYGGEDSSSLARVARGEIQRDPAVPADPRGHRRRAPALGRARLPGRRHRPPAALARRARRPARAGDVRERAHHRPRCPRPARSAG